MTETPITLSTETLRQLEDLSAPPEPFTPGEPLFWDDPHISKQMLDAHLSLDTDAASRRPEQIGAIIDWLMDYLDLEPGNTWLDMGCGPGLYTSRLAQRGLHVIGMDYSRRSIAYALEQAETHNLKIDYRLQNYLELDDAEQYDVISLIYGDFCPLPPDDRATLLTRVKQALKPGGRFVFDVTTPVLRQRRHVARRWSAAPDGGFWRPGPHLMLECGFKYPDDVYLDQYIVLETKGRLTVYRNWFQDYTPEHLTAELTANGFEVEALWSDLMGTPYNNDSEWIGVVAKPVG